MVAATNNLLVPYLPVQIYLLSSSKYCVQKRAEACIYKISNDILFTRCVIIWTKQKVSRQQSGLWTRQNQSLSLPLTEKRTFSEIFLFVVYFDLKEKI